MSFTTAAVLIGLMRAREAGIEVPDRLLEHGIQNILRQRTPEGSYAYDMRFIRMPLVHINRPIGSACRTPNCHLALLLCGHSQGTQEHAQGIENLVLRHRRFQQLSLRTRSINSLPRICATRE